MIQKISTLLLLLLAMSEAGYGQKLKVTQAKTPAVDRSTNNGTATIIFASSVKDLTVTTTYEDQVLTAPGVGKSMYYLLYVNPIEDLKNQMEVSNRTITLHTPKTADYTFTTPIIQPNQVLYYNVTLPDNYPVSLTAEYVYTKSSMHGIRVAYGGRIGGYLCYKWGKYNKAGTCIDDYSQDADVTHATELGNIRKSITGGVRLGVFNRLIPVYVYLGGGYGEYGRQWQNLSELDKNIYFYSDYVKGFEGEVGVSCVLFDYLSLSVGVDALFGNGKVTSDFQLGIGFNINPSLLFKRSHK